MAKNVTTTAQLAASTLGRLVQRIPLRMRETALWDALSWTRTPAARKFLPLGDYVRLRSLARAPAGGSPVALQPRCLSAGPVWLRPGTSDVQVLFNTFIGLHHPPPPGLRPSAVWDLGSNLGLTVAHFAEIWPEARIVGVEPQPYLAAAAANLIDFYGPRCRIIEAAAWSSDGSVPFHVDTGSEYGGHVDPDGGAYSVPSMSLNTLLKETGPVDYVKMDVEGAEEALLRENTEWAQHVSTIKVECHPGYTVAGCVRDLENLGFKALVDLGHESCVLGWRD